LGGVFTFATGGEFFVTGIDKGGVFMSVPNFDFVVTAKCVLKLNV
jgi:hypothetical protein